MPAKNNSRVARAPRSINRGNLHEKKQIRRPIRANNIKKTPPKKRQFHIELRAFSVELTGLNGSFGDKIYLPNECFEHLSVLYRHIKLPYIFSLGTTKSSQNKTYGGVLEFSAPEGICYVPKRMLDAIGAQEGEKVWIATVPRPPDAQKCVFQPLTNSFVELLKTLGPRYFLENALCMNYSVLYSGEMVTVVHNGQSHDIRVEICEPAKLVNIMGNVDINVEFLPALDAAPLSINEAALIDEKSHSAAPHEGEDVDEDEDGQEDHAAWSAPVALSPAEKKEKRKYTKRPQFADGKVEITDDEELCEHCGKGIPKQNFAMHSVHCQRMFQSCKICSQSGIHRNEMKAHLETHEIVLCALGCGEKIVKSSQETHEMTCTHRLTPCMYCDAVMSLHVLNKSHLIPCGEEYNICDTCGKPAQRRDLLHSTVHADTQCFVPCPLRCSERLKAADVELHTTVSCIFRLIKCDLCFVSIPAHEHPAHVVNCGNKTQMCDACGAYIKRRHFGAHISSACQFPVDFKKMEQSLQPMQPRKQPFISTVLTDEQLAARIAAAEYGDSGMGNYMNFDQERALIDELTAEALHGGPPSASFAPAERNIYVCPTCRHDFMEYAPLHEHVLKGLCQRKKTMKKKKPIPSPKKQKVLNSNASVLRPTFNEKKKKKNVTALRAPRSREGKRRELAIPPRRRAAAAPPLRRNTRAKDPEPPIITTGHKKTTFKRQTKLTDNNVRTRNVRK